MENTQIQEGTVVLVDDEEILLNSLRSILELETSYDVFTFTDPEKALQHVESNEVNIVLSDYMMPNMNGVEFLKKVRQLKPDVPRVILTGYADKENAIKAINEVGLFQYIEKPWENEDLLLILQNGIEKNLLGKQLLQKVEEIKKAYSDLQGIQNQIIKTFI